jgi:hypothetical protein
MDVRLKARSPTIEADGPVSGQLRLQNFVCPSYSGAAANIQATNKMNVIANQNISVSMIDENIRDFGLINKGKRQLRMREVLMLSEQRATPLIFLLM